MFPLTMIEKPGVRLFPWSKQEEVLEAEIVGSEGEPSENDDDSSTPWMEEEDFRVARTVGYAVSEIRISIAAAFAIVGITIWIIGATNKSSKFSYFYSKSSVIACRAFSFFIISIRWKKMRA